MSKTIDLQIIEKARALISDPEKWCKHEMAMDKWGYTCSPYSRHAQRFCALGALSRAAMDVTGSREYGAHEKALNIARRMNNDLEAVNDGTGREAILELFDKALIE